MTITHSEAINIAASFRQFARETMAHHESAEAGSIDARALPVPMSEETQRALWIADLPVINVCALDVGFDCRDVMPVALPAPAIVKCAAHRQHYVVQYDGRDGKRHEEIAERDRAVAILRRNGYSVALDGSVLAAR